MKSYIHFIRHGITEGNQKGWYYGRLDIPLADEGVDALKNLVAEGIYPSCESADCYTSGMCRTEQTFKTIFGDVPHKQLPLLMEMNFGSWEGKTFSQLKAEPEFDTWMSTTDGSFVFPGGDSINTFYERIGKGIDELEGLHALKELSHRHDEKDAVSIVVCHGGVIAATMQRYFPGVEENFWKWIPEPGHGFTVYFERSKAVSFVNL